MLSTQVCQKFNTDCVSHQLFLGRIFCNFTIMYGYFLYFCLGGVFFIGPLACLATGLCRRLDGMLCGPAAPPRPGLDRVFAALLSHVCSPHSAGVGGRPAEAVVPNRPRPCPRPVPGIAATPAVSPSAPDRHRPLPPAPARPRYAKTTRFTADLMSCPCRFLNDLVR